MNFSRGRRRATDQDVDDDDELLLWTATPTSATPTSARTDTHETLWGETDWLIPSTDAASAIGLTGRRNRSPARVRPGLLDSKRREEGRRGRFGQPLLGDFDKIDGEQHKRTEAGGEVDYFAPHPTFSSTQPNPSLLNPTPPNQPLPPPPPTYPRWPPSSDKHDESLSSATLSSVSSPSLSRAACVSSLCP